MTVIAPRYCPGARPLGATVMVREAGVTPVVGVTMSQFPPSAVLDEAENANCAPELVTETD